MAFSTRALHEALYIEHVEESAFLVDQRAACVADPEVAWTSLQEWDDRLEAHVDALVLAGGWADRVCRTKAAGGEAGEVGVVLRVLCRRDSRSDALELVAASDPADADRRSAIIAALAAEMPPSWKADIVKALADHPELTAIYASAIGARRIDGERALMQAALHREHGCAEVAWALGRVGTPTCLPALAPLAMLGDDNVREAVAIALLRLGDHRVLRAALAAVDEARWAQRVLGIAGGADATPALLDALRRGKGGPDAVVALGLLGDLASVAPLIELLSDANLGEPAAVALNAITGAGLAGTVFVPHQFDVDELNNEERAAFERDGAVPTRFGQPFGEHESRPLQDQAAWREWLNTNKQRFHRATLWHMGQPHGPAALVASLSAPSTPHAVRAASYEALVIRHGLTMPFEVHLPVRTQRILLHRMAAWASSQTPH